MSLFSLEPTLTASGGDEEDARILRAVANGDRDAFRLLHDRHEGLLFATIYKVLNDQADAEEVLQETFCNLWRKAPLFSPERGRPLTWMTSLARNRAIDRLRSKQRQARLRDALEVDDTRAVSAEPMPDGREISGRRDDCLAVRRAVVELTDCQREAIEMAYFHGLTQQEIADRLGEPVGTVKARIRRGMRRLKAHFEAAGSDD
ncbi:MAG: sigma-70 family RNA polymerase sigma factor [Verrucomicrobiales bacterium]|nr:sigma-70 family RNA polymerase sigma factor [Verrucomicrobiales bacterium]